MFDWSVQHSSGCCCLAVWLNLSQVHCVTGLAIKETHSSIGPVLLTAKALEIQHQQVKLFLLLHFKKVCHFIFQYLKRYT